MKKQYVKMTAIVLLLYVMLSVLIVMFNPIDLKWCSSTKLSCQITQASSTVIYFPAGIIQKFTIVKFSWTDNNKGIRIGNMVYRGLKIGDRVIFKTGESFYNF